MQNYISINLFGGSNLIEEHTTSGKHYIHYLDLFWIYEKQFCIYTASVFQLENMDFNILLITKY